MSQSLARIVEHPRAAMRAAEESAHDEREALKEEVAALRQEIVGLRRELVDMRRG